VVVGWVLLSPAILPPVPTPGPTSVLMPEGSASEPAAAAWLEARVAQPEPLTAGSSVAGTCSPCHPPIITRMRDVTTLPGGGLVAVGTAAPGRSLVWLSADGSQWSMVPDVPDEEGTGLASVAAGPSGVVAVGARAGRPAAWYSTDGRRWRPATGLQGSGAAEMTSVAAFEGGFVAAGGAGPAFGADRSAAFWTSSDGRRWRRVADGPALHAGHVWGLAVAGGRLVAVGTTGDPQAGPAASWTSRNGRHWHRSPTTPALTSGVMLSATAGARGVVAVGRTADGERAAAWHSPDGLHWTAAPAATALRSDMSYAAHAEMGDVAILGTRFGTRFVAVGWVSSSANGTAVAWSSADGLHWQRLPSAASLPGGGMAAVTVSDGRIVAVGSTGWPDTHAADVWLR
jgi:hypothetical protein